MRTKNQESAKISMGHLVEWDTCLSRPQAKRVGGAPAIIRSAATAPVLAGSGLAIYPEEHQNHALIFICK
jgi:hypothetical protein